MMKRSEIEHLIRAAGAITECQKIIVIGSQSILGSYPEAPEGLLKSREADLIPVEHPDRWNLIDGSIGEMSPFDNTYGYYADGVEENTALLPKGWKLRLVRIDNENTKGVTGLCLDPADLMASKLLAGREKDIEFVEIAIKENIVTLDSIRRRIEMTDVSKERKALATKNLSNPR